MNAVERDDIAHAVTQVQAFYGKELDALQMKFWLRGLGDLDVSDVKRALADYTMTGKYAPKPVDIRDLVTHSRETSRRDLPAPEKRLKEAPEHVGKAWRWLIKQWGLGDLYGAPNVTEDEVEDYMCLCNQQAKTNNNPDSIPPHCWLESIWGGPAKEHQSAHLHEASA